MHGLSRPWNSRQGVLESSRFHSRTTTCHPGFKEPSNPDEPLAFCVVNPALLCLQRSGKTSILFHYAVNMVSNGKSVTIICAKQKVSDDPPLLPEGATPALLGRINLRHVPMNVLLVDPLRCCSATNITGNIFPRASPLQACRCQHMWALAPWLCTSLLDAETSGVNPCRAVFYAIA